MLEFFSFSFLFFRCVVLIIFVVIVFCRENGLFKVITNFLVFRLDDFFSSNIGRLVCIWVRRRGG